MRRAALFLLLAGLLPAAGRAGGPPVLELVPFLEQAAQSDPGFQRILSEEVGLRYQEALDTPAADWVVSAVAGYALDLAASPQDPAADASLGLAKLFPFTGTRLDAEVRAGELGRDPNTLGWSLGVSQDLARNAFGRAARMDRDLSGLEVELARHQVVEAYEDWFASLYQFSPAST